MQEEIFSIQSNIDRISLRIKKVHGFPNETFFMGGYDAECELDIFSNNFSARGFIYISTAQFNDLYAGLKLANNTLSGSVKFGSYENDFFTEVTLDGIGHVSVDGYYSKEPGNELKFHFDTDQTFLDKTLQDLSKIVEKYGDNFGKKELRGT
jgi:hypothetical protein